MEKIKAAIEKSKHSRTSSTASRTSNVSQTPLQEIITGEELENLEYVQTRTVELNLAHLEKNRIVALNKNDMASWAIDSIRTQVLQMMEDKGWRTLAIVSPTPESGKTLTSINLAISIAQQSQRTAMLVDLDLRRPRVGAYLGLSMPKSLNDYLDGTADLSEVLVNPKLPRFVVLPTAKPVSKPSEVLSSKKIENLIKDLRERYESRIVIFDLPPVLTADDAIYILPKIDCALLVVGNGMSSQSEIEETMHLLSGINLLGVVLNKAEVQPSSYYYD
ncbi:MAG: CpsD/CapB family tyrosine-protein kinase [Methylotenera sp.]|nr:CpsD/CapB family tyrosine-protein kinase [Methylotenera sp.]